MKAVITVIGTDTMGIIAQVSTQCAQNKVNILDITQKVFEDTFAMIMLVEVDSLNVEFSVFVDNMTHLGAKIGVIIHTMHEDIFNSMHKI